MDLSQDLEEYFGANPVSFFKVLALENSWELVAGVGDTTAFYADGLWRQYLFCFHWVETEQELRITCEYDLRVPKNRSNPLYKTLNLANEKCNGGFFTYCDQQKAITFHGKFRGSDALEINSFRSEQIVSSITGIMDELYPVFQLISWGKEKPDMAIRLAGNHISGFI
ncbi:MAG: hypothetical protein CML37_02145 [Rhodobacteraceae bacterium]|nr:hypothetical protein [Paracoccaceae bacterium]|tara:strand:- start:930 stop:1433 length:504 start_codon:yes stop_codon:yes gene_type:complete